MSSTSTPARSVAAMYRASMLWAILGGIVTFAIADTSPLFFIVFLGSALVVWLSSVRNSRPAPRLMINAVLMLVIAIAGVETLRSGVGVSAFAVFVALLLVVKLLDLRTPRDDGQVLVLCLSLLVASVLTSNSLLTGAMMLVECVLLLRAFVLFQLYAVVKLGRMPSIRVEKRTRIDVRSMMLGAGFVCVLIASVLFVILPRNVGTQAFGQWGAGGSVSGFSDEVQLGRPGRIRMSTTPVLDLVVRDRNGQNIGKNNSSPVYLRGAVLEEYESGNWKRSSIMQVPLQERIQFVQHNKTLRPLAEYEYTEWDFEYNISMRSVEDGPRYLFTPWRPVEFRALRQPMQLGYDFTRGLFLRDGIGTSTLEYEVRTLNEEYRVPQYVSGEPRRRVKQSEINPRIIEKAFEIVRAGGVNPDPTTRPIEQDAAAVRLLETHLRTQYQYTLDALPVPRGRDATEWFLFDRQAGHCEFYASALTLMCRSIGIPARVITGYIASDFNEVTGQYVVRESNAHAWMEAEIAPNHWRTFDGTPPSDFHDIHIPDPGMMRSITKFYESIEYLWGRVVVGFDSEKREQIVGGKMGDFGLSALSDRLLARFAAGRERLVSRAAIVGIIVFGTSMFVGLVLMRSGMIVEWLRFLFAALLARVGMRTHAHTNQSQPVLRLERAINDRLDRAGTPRPAWRPLMLHLRSCAPAFAHDPESLRSLHEGASMIYASRFGVDHSFDAEQASAIVTMLRRSENQTKPSQPELE